MAEHQRKLESQRASYERQASDLRASISALTSKVDELFIELRRKTEECEVYRVSLVEREREVVEKEVRIGEREGEVERLVRELEEARGLGMPIRPTVSVLYLYAVSNALIGNLGRYERFEWKRGRWDLDS